MVSVLLTWPSRTVLRSRRCFAAETTLARLVWSIYKRSMLAEGTSVLMLATAVVPLSGLYEGFHDNEMERRGSIAWSPPWDISDWEMSNGFFQKWGWLVEELPDVLEATSPPRVLSFSYRDPN
jgi:hypothetical protein